MSTPRDPADDTRGIRLPPTETGPVPVSIAHADARWFGVPPPLLLLGLTAASFLAAIVLFATGAWWYGLVLLGVTCLAAGAFLEVAKRRPDSAVTRASATAAVTARERARAAAESFVARSSALAETQRVRSARAVIEVERRRALLRLGEAVHRGDQAAERDARAELAELERSEEELQARLRVRLAETDARRRSAKLSVQQTMIQVPEPYPPPDEGTPPTPTPVPEPSPDPKPDEDERRPAA